MIRLIGVLATAFLLFQSCTKDKFITGKEARISVSADSLLFDTVFTSTGSVTRVVKIFNNNDRKLRLTEVALGGGTNSPFKINIDGTSAAAVKNLEMEANDSMYVFVNVTINPNTAGLPFVVSDSIKIAFNGNEEWVQLQAWGKNARFLKNHVVAADQTWNNDLPYVILGRLQVDAGVSLTIEKGTQVYLHSDAAFIVDGTLVTNGTKQDSVVFRGDRLDEGYRDLPGSWPGMIFRGESKQNKLTHTHIRNAYQSIVLEGPAPDMNPKLEMNACIIDNSYDAGILAGGSWLRAENCLITNCGANISIAYGGAYEFTHCTIASYGTNYIQHKVPVVSIANHATIGGNLATFPLEADFTNCIFWGENGTVDDEIVTDRKGSTVFNVSVYHCLYKAKSNNALLNVVASVKNSPPLFDSINTGERYFDFRLQASSPAVNMGIPAGIVFDLDGKTRAVGLPDAGCYEKQ